MPGAIVFLRPGTRSTAQYSQAVWAAIREVVPRVEQVGIDEGYLDLGVVAASFRPRAPSRRRCRPRSRAATSLSCSLGVGDARRSSARSRPTAASPAVSQSCPRAPRHGSSPRSPCVRFRGSVRGPRSGSRRRRDDVGDARRARRPRAARDPARLGRRHCCATARAASIRASSSSRRSACRSRSRRRSRETSPTARRSTRSCGGWRSSSRSDAPVGGLGRTVTTKLRYADFSLRSRSTTLGRRRSTRPSGSARSPAGCSTAACATAQARCASSASAFRGCQSTAS